MHHLDTDRALAEVHRLLRPGGVAFFGEPLGHNPIINAFRDRTPEARTEDEHPLLAGDVAAMRRRFVHVGLRFHGLAALASGLPGLRWTRPIGKAADALILQAPGLRWQAWQVHLTLRKG